MAVVWTDPADPVSGTSITRAWAVTNVTNLLRWLRAMTGNGSPPGAGQVALSVSTTLTGWFDLVGALAAKVSDIGDTITGDVTINRASSGAPTTGYMLLGNTGGTNYFGFDGTKLVASGALALLSGGITAPGNSTIGGTLGVTGVISGPGTVPLGAVVWFRTLAELTAAGASWTRETTLDGRLSVGAGTTFSQTFVEATSYGANWTPSSNLTVGAIAPLADGNVVLVNTGAITNVGTSAHTHPAPTLNGSGTAWLPPARAGIFGRRI